VTDAGSPTVVSEVEIGRHVALARPRKRHVVRLNLQPDIDEVFDVVGVEDLRTSRQPRDAIADSRRG
jgi:hypothetical protein